MDICVSFSMRIISSTRLTMCADVPLSIEANKVTSGIHSIEEIVSPAERRTQAPRTKEK